MSSATRHVVGDLEHQAIRQSAFLKVVHKSAWESCSSGPSASVAQRLDYLRDGDFAAPIG